MSPQLETLSINDTQLSSIALHYAEYCVFYCYSQCHAECRIIYCNSECHCADVVMLNVMMLSGHGAVFLT